MPCDLRKSGQRFRPSCGSTAHGRGRPRTTSIALRGDKAYSSREHRALLRSRGITAVIPEPADQVANRKRKGAAAGRPVSLDTED